MGTSCIRHTDAEWSTNWRSFSLDLKNMNYRLYGILWSLFSKEMIYFLVLNFDSLNLNLNRALLLKENNKVYKKWPLPPSTLNGRSYVI